MRHKFSLLNLLPSDTLKSHGTHAFNIEFQINPYREFINLKRNAFISQSNAMDHEKRHFCESFF
jgi:hypothetical protein